jgi:phage-related protein
VLIGVGLGVYELIKHFGVLRGLLIVGAAAVGVLTVAMWALDAVPVVALIVGIGLAVAGLIAGIILLVTHWKQVWSDIKKWSVDAWHAIDSDVIQPMGRFFTGTIPGWVSAAGGFFARMWHDVAGYFKNLWNEVTTGILSWWNTTETWFVNLPGNIIKALGDVAHILYDVGMKIIQGLWDGMKHVWKDVTSWLGSLGGWIKNLKGPPSKDAVLLVENGQLIMRGLGVGLRQGYATHVMPVLSSMSGQINGHVRAGIGAGMTPLGAAGSSNDSSRLLKQILAELQAQTRNGQEQLKTQKSSLDRQAALPGTVVRAVRSSQSQLVAGLRGGSLR